jgi:hypothetical protein
MIIALVIFGVVFAIAGLFVGGRVVGGGSGGLETLGSAVVGGLVGYPLGTIVGLVFLKKLFYKTGSLLLGTLGAIVGALATLVLSEPLRLNSDINILLTVFALLVSGLAVGGLYLNRKPPAGT